MSSAEKKKALFVCLGNICRSPIAEAVFLDLIKKLRVENEWEIDSAAIADWHVGKPPDIRAQVVMRTYNLEYDENKRARQIEENDFRHFDFIFGMDTNNILDLKDISPADGKSKILLLGAFDPKGPKDIRDPYGDVDITGYEDCYVQATSSCVAFLKAMAEHKI